MNNLLRKKAVQRSALLPAAALLVGLAGGTALAYTTAHDSIVLKDPSGAKITSLNSGNNAYSAKQTCFGSVGTTACHGTGTSGTLQFTYDQIESHSYHAQNGTSEFKGYNPYNPDATVPGYDKDGNPTGQQVPDAFLRGPQAKAKSWVQSPGHVGNW